MPTGYFRRLSIKKIKPRIIFFFILHFLPPKFCDFCFYSTTLQYNFWKILTFRYNRYIKTDYTDDRTIKNFVVAKEYDHNFTIVMENFHQHNVHIARIE